jgi:hypothetical protein
MLDAYRTALAAAYPEFTAGDQFGTEMTSACAVWLVSLLRTLPDAVARDRVVGFDLAKNRQRLLAVLGAFIEAASAFGQKPRLTQLCEQIRELVTARWADTVEPLPYFSIFTTAHDH